MYLFVCILWWTRIRRWQIEKFQPGTCETEKIGPESYSGTTGYESRDRQRILD